MELSLRGYQQREIEMTEEEIKAKRRENLVKSIGDEFLTANYDLHCLSVSLKKTYASIKRRASRLKINMAEYEKIVGCKIGSFETLINSIEDDLREFDHDLYAKAVRREGEAK